MKLLPNIKDLWLRGLRSGDYKQGRGQLRKSNDHDTFCCLGVLQDLVAPEDWQQLGKTSALHSIRKKKSWTIAGMGGSLTTEFRKRVGLNADISSSLVDMNDGRRDYDWKGDSDHFMEGFRPKSFEEIADFIENNL